MTGHAGHSSAWSGEMSAYLAEHFNAGDTISQLVEKVAVAFGVKLTRNSLTGRIYRLRKTTDLIKRSPEPQIKHTPDEKKVASKERKRKQRAALRVPPAERLYLFPERVQPASELPEPVMLHKTLIDLQPHDCRWIIGTGRDATYCGCAAKNGSSYCEAHHQRAWYPRKKDETVGVDKRAWK